MAIKTTNDLLASLQTLVGDDTSETTLTMVEDFRDTLTDLDTRARGDGVDWEAKYNDMAKQYRDRFFSPIEQPPVKEEAPKKVTINDLFIYKEN